MPNIYVKPYKPLGRIVGYTVYIDGIQSHYICRYGEGKLWAVYKGDGIDGHCVNLVNSKALALKLVDFIANNSAQAI